MAQREIAENLSRFHLDDVIDRPTATPPSVSNGCRRSPWRCQPTAVLLLDEPAAGVPENERHDILAATDSATARVTSS